MVHEIELVFVFILFLGPIQAFLIFATGQVDLNYGVVSNLSRLRMNRNTLFAEQRYFIENKKITYRGFGELKLAGFRGFWALLDLADPM